MQLAHEECFYNIAKNSGKPTVIIHDRGMMDTVGYIGHEGFRRILNKTGWTYYDLRDNRYDAVVHLISAAVDAPEFYNHGNVARYETVEQAAERDKFLRTAYVGHNKIFVIGNDPVEGFKGKMNDTINAVKSVLGLPIEKTSYKKFLVDNRDTEHEEGIRSHKILLSKSGIEPHNLGLYKEGEYD